MKVENQGQNIKPHTSFIVYHTFPKSYLSRTGVLNPHPMKPWHLTCRDPHELEIWHCTALPLNNATTLLLPNFQALHDWVKDGPCPLPPLTARLGHGMLPFSLCTQIDLGHVPFLPAWLDHGWATSVSCLHIRLGPQARSGTAHPACGGKKG